MPLFAIILMSNAQKPSFNGLERSIAYKPKLWYDQIEHLDYFMSNWFLIALVAPVLWSVVNHIDKYMLSKYMKDRGVGALLIFSALSSVLILPFVGYFFRTEIFDISGIDLIILLFVGFLSAGAFYFYLKAMEIEEASVVVPLFQFDPIFGYILGYLILRESLNIYQILASILILLGIILLSVEIDAENKFKLKRNVLCLVAVSSFLFALNGVVFKRLALVDSFWTSIFWQYVGITIAGVVVLIYHKKFRENFVTMITNHRLNIISLNVSSEILYIAGAVANNFALLIAPIAIVFVVNSYQPLFVFASGVLLTIMFPTFVSEKISSKHFIHKLISIVIITIGSYLLYSTSN